MIKLEIPIGVIERAREKAEEMGVIKGSFSKGAGSLCGFIAEGMLLNYLKEFGAKEDNTYDYDVTVGDIKIDTKAKNCNSAPLNTYEASISTWNIKQKCDWYSFWRVENNLKFAYLCGFSKKEDYFARARACKKGERDGGFVFKSDCWNLSYKDLVSPEEFKKILNEK